MRPLQFNPDRIRMVSEERRNVMASEEINELVQAIKDYPPEISRVLIQRVIDAGDNPDESE